jgi:hypothetical protein
MRFFTRPPRSGVKGGSRSRSIDPRGRQSEAEAGAKEPSVNTGFRERADEIPLSSGIVAVVGAFDAMTSDRAYGVKRTVDQALAELRGCSGSQFDPAVADAFTAVFRARDGDLLAPRISVAA